MAGIAKFCRKNMRYLFANLAKDAQTNLCRKKSSSKFVWFVHFNMIK